MIPIGFGSEARIESIVYLLPYSDISSSMLYEIIASWPKYSKVGKEMACIWSKLF